MSRHIGARQRKNRAALTESTLASILRTTLPRRNGYAPADCGALIQEARHFGVHTGGQFRRLLLKHRGALIADDRAALADGVYMRAIRADRGEDYVSTSIRKQRCFAWEALVRNAFELEFGEAYEAFARARDEL